MDIPQYGAITMIGFSSSSSQSRTRISSVRVHYNGVSILVTMLGMVILFCQIDTMMGFVVPKIFTKSTARVTTDIIHSNEHIHRISSASSSSFILFAKKKTKKKSAGKGFGKQSDINTIDTDNNNNSADLRTVGLPSQQQPSSSYLTSVDGGSSSVPTRSMDENLSSSEPVKVEDRTGQILREKYGLRTREEQEAAELKKKQVEEQRAKLNQWKKMADEGEDFDLFKVLPAPVLVFIDGFLKVGVTISTSLFLLAGVAITFEAGSKALDKPLPVKVDAFIATIVEPNFTPGLLVLLSFSVGLGAFASLQLNSAASTYREDK